MNLIGVTSITRKTHRKPLKYTELKNFIKRKCKLEEVNLIRVIIEITGLYRKKNLTK